MNIREKVMKKTKKMKKAELLEALVKASEAYVAAQAKETKVVVSNAVYVPNKDTYWFNLEVSGILMRGCRFWRKDTDKNYLFFCSTKDKKGRWPVVIKDHKVMERVFHEVKTQSR